MNRADQATGRAPNALWFALTAAGLLVILIDRFAPTELPGGLDLPAWAARAGALAITTTYSFGLLARTGGPSTLGGGMALVLGTAAVLSDRPILLAGAAVSTAVLAGVLAVMATKPAARFPRVVRECLIAATVAVVGGFATAAYGAQVSIERLGFLAFALSLLGALGLVYRLGAGLHSLGRRGSIMLGVGVLVLLLGVAYTEALTRWGSAELIAGIRDTTDLLRSTLGAVPSPLGVFVGFPALAWGVLTRSRTRQGWWVCAFGAPALAMVAVSLVDPDRTLTQVGLSLGYSAALGLALGYLVIRVDQFLAGTRGRRARRLQRASVRRPEPGRLQPLL